jgi:hypothetical protein
MLKELSQESVMLNLAFRLLSMLVMFADLKFIKLLILENSPLKSNVLAQNV